MASLLKDSSPESVRLVRSIIGNIAAKEVKFAGMQRGSMRLVFRIDGWAAMAHLFSTALTPTLLEAMKPAETPGESFTIDLSDGQDEGWGPKIVQWRDEGVLWRIIVERTGLTLGGAYASYARAKGREVK